MDGSSCLLEVDGTNLPYLKLFQGIYRYHTSGICKLASVLEDNSSIINNLLLALNIASTISEPIQIGEYWLSSTYSTTEYVGGLNVNGIEKKIPYLQIVLSRTAPMSRRLTDDDRVKALALLDSLQDSLVTLRLPKNSKSSIEMVEDNSDTF
jgi:hypothetical protein